MRKSSLTVSLLLLFSIPAMGQVIVWSLTEMQRRIRRHITGVILLALLGSVGLAEAIGVGDKAPDFKLTDLDGRLHSLDQYKGKVRVLFFLGHD